MREIKFRAWDKARRVMIDDLICFGKNKDGRTYIAHNNEFNSAMPPFHGYMWDSRNLEIMQYTGLLDSKGKEIYEGDIVKCGTFIGAVEYIAPEWIIKIRHTYLKANYPHIEIVGNIYEHPDLLMEAK